MMALALGLVGQPVQPYLTTGATDFVNSVQKGKEDAIKTAGLVQTNQKNALDILATKKKADESAWATTNANDLKAKADKGELDAASIARMNEANPEFAKLLGTAQADAVKNFYASNLIGLNSATDQAGFLNDLVQAHDAHNAPLPESVRKDPKLAMQYYKMLLNGAKAFDDKTASMDESGNVITKDVLGNTTAINPAAVKAAKATPVIKNGKRVTQRIDLPNGRTRTEQLMSDDTWQELDTSAPPAPKEDKTELTTAQKATFENQLRNEYRADSKTFLELKRQTAIIRNSLNDPSAAGTLSAATAYMKMLDPGSVVRESELGMAMQATGALDRLNNYFHTLEVGKTLTATQKEDFGRLAGQYMEAADQAQENLNKTYTEIAVRNKLTPENIIMFKPDKKPTDNQGAYQLYVQHWNNAKNNPALQKQLTDRARKMGIVK